MLKNDLLWIILSKLADKYSYTIVYVNKKNV